MIDECQLAFDGDPDTVALVTDLGKRGPAAGIIVLLATQRVDAQSLPTGISSNAVLRLCFKVTGQVENDMVLGTSTYKAGIRATMFARTDQGIGYLAGEGDDPVIVRTAYLDAPAAETVVARARAARLAAGLLTGHAAGIEPEPDPSTDHPCWTTSSRSGRPPRTARPTGLVGRPRRPARRDPPRPVRRLDRRAGLRRRQAARPQVGAGQTHRSTAAKSTAAASPAPASPPPCSARTRRRRAAGPGRRLAPAARRHRHRPPTSGPTCDDHDAALSRDRSRSPDPGYR